MTQDVDQPDPLWTIASAQPDAVAVIAPTGTFTYGELEQHVAATAQRLRTLGCERGIRIGVHVPAGWASLVTILAILRAGGVSCPVSTRLPAGEAAAQLRQAAARLLVAADPGLFTQDGFAQDGLEADVVSLKTVVQEEQDGRPSSASPERWDLDVPATLVFTSGSAGEAKAALHSLGNHFFSALGSSANIPIGPGDRWLAVLPFYHVGGLSLIFRCLLAEATLVMPTPNVSLGAALRRYDITHVSLVATQLGRLLREESGAPSRLRAVLVGGSAVSFSLIREAHQQGYPIHTTYGLTEMTSQVTTTPPGARLDRLGTSGRCLPHRAVRVADDGEILVRGAVLFQGYVEGKTVHRPVDAEGWYHTKDRGVLDAEGYLQVLGRLDNMFISGGENIHPEEIERALCAWYDVEQAVVVPRDDPAFGHRPVAFVAVRGRFPSTEVWEARLAAVLPRFKIPVAFYPWPEEAPARGFKLDRLFFEHYASERDGASP